MALADFDKLTTIAKGSFGVVYKATRKDTGRVYALKQVDIANMNRAEREEAVDEVHSYSPPGTSHAFCTQYTHITQHPPPPPRANPPPCTVF